MLVWRKEGCSVISLTVVHSTVLTKFTSEEKAGLVLEWQNKSIVHQKEINAETINFRF